MQNRYVGDIGDFGNNGLLRWLTGVTGPAVAPEDRLRLGVVWYLHPDECHNADGKHINYLFATPGNLERFAECDLDLYHALARLVSTGNRKISAIQRRGILPRGTAFYDRLVPTEAYREEWLRGALRETSLCEVLFVNPDTGIASDEANLRDCSKYAYMSELQRFAERGQSLVIYHHFSRSNHHRQILRVREELQEELAPLHVISLRYSPIQPRAYFIASQPGRHQDVIEARLMSFCGHPDSPWYNLFEWVV